MLKAWLLYERRFRKAARPTLDSLRQHCFKDEPLWLVYQFSTDRCRQFVGVDKSQASVGWKTW